MNEQAVVEDDQIEVAEEEVEVPEIVDEEEPEDTEDDVVVSIGEDAPPQEEQTPAPKWLRELRKTNRELQRQNRELKSKVESAAQAETKPVVLGKKPTLEDHDYDPEPYEAALSDWFTRKRQADDAQAQQEVEAMNQQKAWKAKLDGYGKARSELRVRDFEEAEAVVQEAFNVTQQGVVLQGAENPALVVYAIGKNQKKLKELSDIKDPVKFAFAVARLEKELKVTSRKSAAPQPERIVSGTGRVSGAVDSTLERLREEAAKTGNMTKVIQYKQQKRASSK